MSELAYLRRKQDQDPEAAFIAADILRARMRSGELPGQHVRWCAQLGHEESSILFPAEVANKDEDAGIAYILENAQNRIFCIQFSLFMVKKWLPIFKVEYPLNWSEAEEAIKYFRDWLANPSKHIIEKAKVLHRKIDDLAYQGQNLNFSYSKTCIAWALWALTHEDFVNTFVWSSSTVTELEEEMGSRSSLMIEFLLRDQNEAL